MYAPTRTRSGAARSEAATARTKRNARSGRRTSKGRRGARLCEALAYNRGMADRSGDWMAQAERDVGLARAAAREAFHEWACFAAPDSYYIPTRYANGHDEG